MLLSPQRNKRGTWERWKEARLISKKTTAGKVLWYGIYRGTNKGAYGREIVLMKYFEGMLMVLGWLVLGLLTYMALHALCMWIAGKIEQKIKLKTIEGKIDKINKLIKEINYEEKRVKAFGKYLELEDIEGVTLSDKKIE